MLGNGEQCDDGNQNNNDGCSNDCALPGVALWQVIVDGAGSEDQALAIAVDGAGQVLITGTREPAGSDVSDMILSKYKGADGAALWSITYDGGLFLDDSATALATDSQDNVVVTGGVFVANNGLDLWLGKYNWNAQSYWDFSHSGPTGGGEEGRGVAVDGADNVIVVGGEIGLMGGKNVWITKYDPDGNEIWNTTYDGLAGSSDQATSVAIDGEGNIVVAGYERTVAQGDDVWIGKYGPDGGEIWTTTWNGWYNGQDQAMGVAVDLDGNVIATGNTRVATNITDGAVVDLWVGKFDSDGLFLWERTVDGAISGSDYGEAVVVDGLGNAVVVGSVAIDEYAPNAVWNGYALVREGWVRKYGPDGETLWTHTFGPNNDGAWAYGVALDAIDNVFVTGQMRTGPDLDIIIRKLAP